VSTGVDLRFGWAFELKARDQMNRDFGLFIFVGMAIGALFGLPFAEPIGNALLAVGIGALAGLFLGWFLAAARRQLQKEKRI
jgi:NhaP-type Na+/H+ or K+/H+ antiporter